MKYIKLICLAALLMGCVRPSSTQSYRVIEPSATAVLPSPTGLAALTATATSTLPLATKTLPPSPTATLPPDGGVPPVGGITPSAATAQTLLDYPLAAGNSWVYRYEGHTGNQKAAWKVSDTVVEVQMHGAYYAARIQSEVALLEGNPGADFINPPQAHTFWYVVDGPAVYRMEDPLDWTAVRAGWLELQFPLPQANCWYPDAAQRAQSPAGNLPGCRSASGPSALDTPAGHFENCFQVITAYNDGNFLYTFCRGIGFVASDYQHTGTDFGSHVVLSGYLLQ